MAMACTYLFLDEAGDLNFSPSGTKHFVLSSIAMRRPFPVLSEIDHYKHDCLEYGLPTEYFHCSEDNPHVRGRIFDIIARRLTDIKVDSLVVEKRKTVPALRADYANWAIFRKWERADDEFHRTLAPAIRSEFNIFAGGTTTYY